MSDDNRGSGLELDLSQRQRPAARRDQPIVAAGGERPRRARPLRDDEPSGADDIDSATGGTFIVLALVHSLAGVALAFAMPRGNAVMTLVVILLSSVLTYAGYYVTGFIARHLGVIGLVLFGGWFSLLVGFAAQAAHQLFPWLSWKILGVVVVVAFGVALALDMR